MFSCLLSLAWAPWQAVVLFPRAFALSPDHHTSRETKRNSPLSSSLDIITITIKSYSWNNINGMLYRFRMKIILKNTLSVYTKHNCWSCFVDVLLRVGPAALKSLPHSGRLTPDPGSVFIGLLNSETFLTGFWWRSVQVSSWHIFEQHSQ